MRIEEGPTSTWLELTISLPSCLHSSASMEVEEEENNNSGGPPRKKLRLTKDQSRLLEERFKLTPTLNPKQKEELAKELKLNPRQVEVWFQNRRARSKLKQTEMECEYLKRCFGSLTELNRRLNKEVATLRALRAASPPPHPLPPLSSLTMCPRCERVTATTAATAIAMSPAWATAASPAATSAKASPLLLDSR